MNTWPKQNEGIFGGDGNSTGEPSSIISLLLDIVR
jgi:hypothetical protein